MTKGDVRATVEAVWRIESARVIAAVARVVRDVGLAEDLAQEAFVAALEQWPERGVPDNPGAWLTATAKHRAVDRLRRAEVHDRKVAELGRDAELWRAIEHDLAAEVDDPFDDDLLRLIFNEGYSASSGEDIIRPELMEEALRLGRILAELLPDEAEVHGLAALLEFQASRTRARVSADGEQILLADQDRARWDRLLIRRGLAALERAYATGGPIGPYTLQAAIAACHAVAPTAEDTDWERIVSLYDGLAQIMPSPVVELNRAVAIGMASGPQEALALVDELADEPALAEYPPLPAVRADLLERLGRHEEAAAEYERAALLTSNTRRRAELLARAQACAPLAPDR